MKQRKYVFIFFIIIIFLFICILAMLYVVFFFKGGYVECDGIAHYFQKTPYSGNNDQVVLNFFDDLTFLDECYVVNISEEKKGFKYDIFSKYGIQSVKYLVSCDIMDVEESFYFINGSLYFYSLGMGPCDQENIHISSTINEEELIWNIEMFSEALVQDSMSDPVFCQVYHQRIDEYENYMNQCKLFEAHSYMYDDPMKALSLCDELHSRQDYLEVSNCYDKVIESYFWKINSGSSDPTQTVLDMLQPLCFTFYTSYVPDLLNQEYTYPPRVCEDLNLR